MPPRLNTTVIHNIPSTPTNLKKLYPQAIYRIPDSYAAGSASNMGLSLVSQQWKFPWCFS
jgi:hypothetical protein